MSKEKAQQMVEAFKDSYSTIKGAGGIRDDNAAGFAHGLAALAFQPDQTAHLKVIEDTQIQSLELQRSGNELHHRSVIAMESIAESMKKLVETLEVVQ